MTRMYARLCFELHWGFLLVNFIAVFKKEEKMTFQLNTFGENLLWLALKWGITIYVTVWVVILSCGIGKKKGK